MKFYLVSIVDADPCDTETRIFFFAKDDKLDVLNEIMDIESHENWHQMLHTKENQNNEMHLTKIHKDDTTRKLHYIVTVKEVDPNTNQSLLSIWSGC